MYVCASKAVQLARYKEEVAYACEAEGGEHNLNLSPPPQQRTSIKVQYYRTSAHRLKVQAEY